MKNIRGILNLKHRSSSQSLFSFVSTVVIIAIGALVYSAMVYERPLSVNNPTGVSTGPSIAVGGAFQPAGLAIMSLSVIMSIVIFGFLARTSKRHNFPTVDKASQPDSVSNPLEEPNEGLQSEHSLMQKKAWETAPTEETTRQ